MLNLFVVLAGLVILIASALFGVFLPLSRGTTTVSGQRIVPAPKVHILRGLIFGTIGAIVMIIGLAGPFVEVPAGNVGVVTNFGQVQNVTLEPGLHLVIPIYQRVTNVDTRVQPHAFEEIDAASKELQTVKLTGVMNYHIDGVFASDLFQRVGTDFAAKIIDPAFNDFIKTVVPDYSVNDILAKRDEIRSLAKTQLAANLAQYHIIVDDIYIANIAFSDGFQQAIEAKQVAQQQVQTEQQILAQKEIQAQQAVAQAKGQADSNVTLAEGQAKATVALANGQAEANKALAASLSDQILQYQYIQKLTDKITVMLLPSGNQTIFDLKGLLGQATAP
ncbi:MAG: prohibitin family protein [Chloroflexi bacterium]|nr:prohibitin family protein [Chloroflexota bacterium]